MKFGLDGIPLAAAKTGIGHYTLELSDALARLAPADEFQLISPVPFVASNFNSHPSNLKKVEAPKRRVWWFVGLPLYIRRQRLSLFHGTNYDVPFWNECPTVLSIHDLSLLLHTDTHLKSLVRRARRRMPLMARAATKIITATEFIKLEVIANLKVDPARIAVTPYAPRRTFKWLPPEQAEQTRLRLGIEKEFILFVGTIEPRKNLLTLMRAFVEILRNTDQRPQLVVAGQKGWLVEETLNYVGRENLGDRVVFTGYVSDADLRALYSSCTVCVYPSLYEGFGLPPLEAMACGAPVITSDLECITETTGKAAVLVPPLDVDRMAQEIVEMLRNEDKRAQYSQLGLRRASQFTWERTAQMTLDVYREVLGKKF